MLCSYMYNKYLLTSTASMHQGVVQVWYDSLVRGMHCITSRPGRGHGRAKTKVSSFITMLGTCTVVTFASYMYNHVHEENTKCNVCSAAAWGNCCPAHDFFLLSIFLKM